MGNSISENKSAVNRRKDDIIRYLRERDFNSLLQWAQSQRTSIRTISSLLFDSDPLVRWRAIEGIGLIAGLKAQHDTESVRRLIRRLLWLMSDESGGICWYAPEAIGEILVNVPQMRAEFIHVLVSFADEEPFEAGVRWAIYRLAPVVKTNSEQYQVLKEQTDRIKATLSHDNPRIRGTSVLALRALGVKIIPGKIKSSSDTDDTFPFYDYDSGKLRDIKVSDNIESA